MGKYCDVCKNDDSEQWIQKFVCYTNGVDWIDMEFHICKSCALKIKEAIDKVKRQGE